VKHGSQGGDSRTQVKPGYKRMQYYHFYAIP
jgi:hypothetical protein